MPRLHNFLLQDYQTAAADIILFKGVLQIPLFGGIIWWGQRKRSRSLEITNGEANKNEKSLDVLPPKHVDKVTLVISLELFPNLLYYAYIFHGWLYPLIC